MFSFADAVSVPLRLCMHGGGWAGHPWCWSHVSNIPLPGTLLSREPLTMSAETKTEIKPRMRRIEGLMAQPETSWLFDIGSWKREQLASAEIKRANRGVITVTGRG